MFDTRPVRSRLHNRCRFCGAEFHWVLPYERLRRHMLRNWFDSGHGWKPGAHVPRHRLVGRALASQVAPLRCPTCAQEITGTELASRPSDAVSYVLSPCGHRVFIDGRTMVSV